jgi:hypothetical protein
MGGEWFNSEECATMASFQALELASVFAVSNVKKAIILKY